MKELVKVPDAPMRGRNLIGGEWQKSEGHTLIEVTSPYTGAVIGTVPQSTADDVSVAVAKAKQAFGEWSKVPIKERTQTMFRFRELVLANIDRLSNLAALEAGKTVGEARAGVLKGVEIIEYALSIQNLDQGGVLEVSRGVTCELRREPLGVVAGITPFNFPAMVPMWMFPIAVTLGNAFILKASEKVPLSSVVIGELMVEAGFPAGVFSLVHGGRTTVEALVDHPDVAAVGFVGSTAAAKAVYTRATALGKRALALGGAKNPLILVPDADPDITIDGVVASFTGCAGQRCMAASVLLAVGDVESLLSAIVERTKKIELGPEMGALIDKAAYTRLVEAIGRAESEGVKVVVDGRNAKAPAGYENGNWLAPTILDGAKPDQDCATRELFGPVLTIVRVKTLDDALDFATSSGYGNATSVFTTRGAVARHVIERATAGMVGVNIGVPVPREPYSFGGTRDSRFGVGDMTGQGALDFWSFTKKITTKYALQPDHNWMS